MGRTDYHDYAADHTGWMNFNELLRNINDGMKLMQRIEQYLTQFNNEQRPLKLKEKQLISFASFDMYA